uniref:Brix domain-containing protein n=1 Tax=Acrobeloides nanus TaxID=290746 RepID=A0A914BWL2_9BILA
MFRREARLRREFIYRKSLEEKQKALVERRKRVKDAIENNKEIPTDLRKEALALSRDSTWGEGLSTVDDEYRWAGCEDPKIVITTSRNPSAKLKMFAKEIKLTFPNSQRINRGGHDIKGIIQACKANDVTDLILINETRGVPTGVIVSHLPHGPTMFFNLSNVVMRHEIEDCGPMSEQYPHLIFQNLNSKLGQRVTNVLKYLFPVPKADSKRVVTFANQKISFHSVNMSIEKMKLVKLSSRNWGLDLK